MFGRGRKNLFRDYKVQGNNYDAFSTPDLNIWWRPPYGITVPSVTTVSILQAPPFNGTVAAMFEQYCVSSLDAMDDVIITETLSKANDKEIDLLTTLAELPKTAQSILDGFRLIGKITRDAKNREIVLTNSFSTFSRRQAKLGYARYRYALAQKRASLRKRGNKRVQDRTLSLERWSKLNEAKLGSETAVEILDAITGVWADVVTIIHPNASYGV